MLAQATALPATPREKHGTVSAEEKAGTGKAGRAIEAGGERTTGSHDSVFICDLNIDNSNLNYSLVNNIFPCK